MEIANLENVRQQELLFAEIVRKPRFRTIYESFEGLLGKQFWTAFLPDGKRIPLALKEGEKPSPVTPEGWALSNCFKFAWEDIEKSREEGSFVIGTCSESQQLRAIVPFFHKELYQGAFSICFLECRDIERVNHCINILAEYLNLLSETLEEYDDTSVLLPLWDEMVATRELDDLLRRVLGETLTLLQLDKGVIFLVDEDLKMRPEQGQGASKEQIKAHPVDLRMRDYEDTAQTWDSIVVDLPEGDRIADWIVNLFFNDKPLKDEHVIGLPIIRDGALLALVAAISPNTPLDPLIRLRTLHLLMEGASAAISNALIFERMNQKALALNCIHAMHRLMNYPVTEDDLLARIGRVILQALRVNKCSIMLIDSKRELLQPRVQINLDENEVGSQTLECGQSIPGWVWENYAPLIVNSWKDDHRFENDPPEWYSGERYLSMPMIESDILGVVTVSGKEKDFTTGDREVLQSVTEQAVIALNNARLCQHQQHLTLNTLKSIANVVEMKDPYKVGHTEKVAETADRIAASMGLDYETRLNLKYAALLHDAGGIGPQALASSKGGNTADAVRDMESHLQMSIEIAQSLGLSETIIKMIRHHHENFDGSGYPKGLRGQAIPLGSRIIAVADIYVALTAGRGRHRALSPQEAITFIRNLSGKRFDPEVVSLLARIALQNR